VCVQDTTVASACPAARPAAAEAQQTHQAVRAHAADEHERERAQTKHRAVLLEVLVVEAQPHVVADARGDEEEGQDDGQQQEDLQAAGAETHHTRQAQQTLQR
jgi:hypothetical protein